MREEFSLPITDNPVTSEKSIAAGNTDKSQGKIANALTILNLTELSEGEQLRVIELAKSVIPNGNIQGIIRGSRSWDLRPLIREGNATRILRLYGPEVMLSATQSARALKQLQLLANLQESNSGLIEFGTLDSQVFALRPLYLNTLGERISSGERFSFLQALGIALELMRIVKTWHKAGITHGHLSPGNICFAPNGEIFIVDAGVLQAQLISCRELNSTAKFVDEKYIAPELVRSTAIDARDDIYSLGLVFSELFRKVRRSRNEQEYDPDLERMNTADVEAIAELTSGMIEPNIAARAPLEFVERLLDSRANRPEPIVSVVIPEPEPQPVFSEPKSRETNREANRELPLNEGLVDESSRFEGARFLSVPLEEPSNTWKPEVRTIETAVIPESGEYESIVSEEMAESTSLSSKIIKGALIVLTIACLFFGYRIFFTGSDAEFASLTQEELQANWDSVLLSEKSLVADAAVQSVITGNPEQQKQAERIILKAAMSGDRASDAVNYSLIRLAFNEKWERRLNANDRKVALTIALKRLIEKEYLPKESVELAAIHPGVIFAIMSIEGNVPGLDTVPAARLTSLPAPINLAFQELLNGNPEMKCSDPGAIGLARFYSRDLSVEDVTAYLSEDTETRLRALAILLYSERIKSKQLIELLLHHPNYRLEHELIRWGIKVNLLDWPEVDSSGQLFVLSGLPITAALSAPEYVQMLAHPLPKSRQFAIDKVVNLIALAHPGAVPFLKKLKEHPEILTGKQTLELAQFLEKPSIATKEAVQTWCETNPNPSVMADLLSSTANQKNSTPFDSNLSLCLQHSTWQPSLEALKRLSTHPDSLTRVFVYTKLAEAGAQNPGKVIPILQGALSTEPRDDLRRQIELNISSLRVN